ncbi:MAG TPA: ABC transporter permease [Roseovarius sp.]|nr:ABC transporter permease [Roseovarius sp.]
MFHKVTSRSGLQSALSIAELVYHATVRSVRKSHGNAFMALFNNIMTAVIFVLAFYVMFWVLGIKSARIRGDFLLYMMTGIFLFLTHIKALGAVVGAEGPSSPMMQHAPMNTIISVTAAALGSLYIQVLSMFVILFVYHVGFTPFEIAEPVGAFAMLLLAWFTGVSIGLVLLAIKPWAPGFVAIFTTIYQRANMIASGKMFVANSLPPFMLSMFDWNPLFHAIDQCRGFTFINYFPRNSSVEYPLTIAVVLLLLGMMGEFYTRQYASKSWESRR